MSEAVLSFSVRELLADNGRYCVPMYQRNYAWGEGEIHQLIRDVQDLENKSRSSDKRQPYYIGNLVVYVRHDGSFEVIDGQQRFTTLTLMAICLKRLAASGKISVEMGWFNKPNLIFESREKSTHTLTRLMQRVALDTLRNDNCNPDLLNGFSLLEKHLLTLGDQLNNFCDYLFEEVQISRVPVPEDTDLNHYFEVMNSRGEQLEKHEVVKARLMSALHTIADKFERKASLNVLTKVWGAAVNMERYVQYGFTTEERHQIFGNNWGQFTPKDFAELSQLLVDQTTETKKTDEGSKSLQLILETPPPTNLKTNSEFVPERFKSVVNFSNFLLHVLRIWTGKDIPLDDKQLIDQFDKYILRTDNPAADVKGFIFALLKIKCLFDQYIIKREFSDGVNKWSLKRLHYSDKSQSYVNTFEQDAEDGFEGINRRILMLLSAMHVSTPTSDYKHWLNGALHILYDMTEVKSGDYLSQLERLARQFMYGRYLSMHETLDYYSFIYKGVGYTALDIKNPELSARLNYGSIENNFVFNYLDYLLWCKAMDEPTSDEVIKQFEFTFRSSVEHYYPQHPIDGDVKIDQKSLHSFGNLCLISHSKNSRLSNYQPKAKRDHFNAAIARREIDSLKLYEMIKLMDIENSWDEEEIKKHEFHMLEILEADSESGRG